MKIMTHVVAGYPSVEECVELMLGMQKAGVRIIEVQIPFSDPIADGETIMRANDRALSLGMNTKKSFDLIRRARQEGLRSEVYIMSYIQKLVSYGFEEFCRGAIEAGTKGLIVPDLPFDSPEYKELKKVAGATQLQIVPVVSPGMGKRRLAEDLVDRPDLIYLTSNKGITGNKLAVSAELDRLCAAVRKLAPQAELAVGFGIRNKKDVLEVQKNADIAVVGSAVIRKTEEAGISGALKLIKDLSD